MGDAGHQHKCPIDEACRFDAKERERRPGACALSAVDSAYDFEMRFNERELISLSRQPSDKAAELGMRGPKKGDVVKKRLVKLVVNFLFYFRTDEDEPLGALLLEECRVEREDSQAFSIAFLDEAERKYLFECDSQEQCLEWIDSIVRASYEFMRKSLIFYRTEIHRMTGKDPLEQYGISDETRFQISSTTQPVSKES